MLLLALAAVPSVSAIPLDPCLGSGSITENLLDKGGLIVWEDPDGSGQPVAMTWGKACSEGGTGVPVPRILTPDEGFAIDRVKTIAVYALAGDPDGGFGRCAWWVEQDGVRWSAPVAPTGSKQFAVDQPWVGSRQVCAGTVNVGALAPGPAILGVTATDLHDTSGDATVVIRVNNPPQVAFVSPDEGTPYLPGDLVEYMITVSDDVSSPVGAEVSGELLGDDGVPVPLSCEVDGHGNCYGSVVAPLVPGPYTLTAWWTDGDGREGMSAPRGVVVNDTPGVFITAPTDGVITEAGETLEVAVSVVDATAVAGDVVSLRVEQDGRAWAADSCSLDPSLVCTIAYAEGAVGRYTLTAEYTDAYGLTAESDPVEVVFNDTPGLASEGLADGDIVDPGEAFEVALRVVDTNPTAGRLYAFVSDGSTSTTWGPFSADGAGEATAGLTLSAAGTYEVSFAFVDEYEVSVETAPVTVVANHAPAVTLDDPVSGAMVEVPANDEEHRWVSYRFTTADADDALLSVNPAAGYAERVTCGSDATGLGEWVCELDTAGLAVGTHDILVEVTDDWETVYEEFAVIVVDGTDFDYDGDGLLESEWIEWGNGVGDCDPYDATVHGESYDRSLSAATEVCDDLDNDCDGEVNDGLPDEGGASMAEAEGAMGTVVTTTNGGSTPDVTFEGSVHNQDDVDWWYFEVGTDGAEARNNAAFTVTLTVPEGADGEPEGEWALDVWTSTTGSPTAAVEAYYLNGPEVDCVSPSEGVCALVWDVSGAERTVGEVYWWISIGAASWVPEYCSEDSSTPTYTLDVVD